MVKIDLTPLDPSVPVIHFHGTDDIFAPYEGRRGIGLTRTIFYSVKHSIDNWVKANGCAAEPRIEEFEDKHEDSTKIIRKVWPNGKQGSEVVLIRIEGGGHTWPGIRCPQSVSASQPKRSLRTT